MSHSPCLCASVTRFHCALSVFAMHKLILYWWEQETNQEVPGWLANISARSAPYGQKSSRGGRSGGNSRFGGRDYRQDRGYGSGGGYGGGGGSYGGGGGGYAAAPPAYGACEFPSPLHATCPLTAFICLSSPWHLSTDSWSSAEASAGYYICAVAH